jgi:hypothetical protein
MIVWNSPTTATNNGAEPMMTSPLPVVLSEETDPVELAKAQARHHRAERNSAWLQAHVPEIYAQHRGKCICVAGEQLFVTNTPEEAFALAKTAHPEDDGILSRYIPREKLEPIYHVASQTLVAV